MGTISPFSSLKARIHNPFAKRIDPATEDSAMRADDAARTLGRLVATPSLAIAPEVLRDEVKEARQFYEKLNAGSIAAYRQGRFGGLIFSQPLQTTENLTKARAGLRSLEVPDQIHASILSDILAMQRIERRMAFRMITRGFSPWFKKMISFYLDSVAVGKKVVVRSAVAAASVVGACASFFARAPLGGSFLLVTGLICSYAAYRGLRFKKSHPQPVPMTRTKLEEVAAEQCEHLN